MNIKLAFLLTFVYNKLAIKYGLWAISIRLSSLEERANPNSHLFTKNGDVCYVVIYIENIIVWVHTLTLV